MKAVHFGAGNIGRGFIGALLSESGFETIFVDVNAELIEELNQKGTYQVELAGTYDQIKVNKVSGLNSMEEETEVIEALAEADVITTAVGPNVLPLIAPLLAKGLLKKNDRGIVIACENMVGGSEALKSHVLENVTEDQKVWISDQIDFPNAAVDRIVPNQNQQDPLTVMVEPYFEWVVETAYVRTELPNIEGITYVEDLTPYIERKLFTVNTGHAVAAYLGKYNGYKTIKEALDDRVIKDKIQGALHESGSVLIEKYGFNTDEHREYIEKIISRFENPDLSDEVTRVGRGPIRKLGPRDRLVRPALEFIRLKNEEPAHLAEVIAATLYYVNESDPEAVKLQEMIQENGRLEAFREIAELEEDHPLVQAVKKKLSE
ncbi:mannitol-1-phosphate 5-dehydrogenase [Halobacillus sp. BBL2006]|uniref:mannitol-1-phosphate 5-dehydrogenase n=1 Tax=Halobacillus sp. BBL2006 TaxID=1543706 RepID=UPI000542A224|nr:mannitol-1-phosphate 5-dehydrogenase [Halobacillus sp. BBL2006]KHE70763.1 mannitol-1-phosphate 5-dehydrogenase [Halobacillus sp. BBL2006]